MIINIERNKLRILATVILLLVVVPLGISIGQVPENAIRLIVGASGLILVGLVLSRPYFGIVITIGILPILDALPSIIFICVGALTLVGLLGLIVFNKHHKLLHQFNPIHRLALLFVIWIFVSNPSAAWSGGDRNWIITFVQLLVLAWLTSELIVTQHQHAILMWVFTILSVFSAFLIIYQATTSLNTDQHDLAGLVGSANSAGRYFVASIVFILYLKDHVKSILLPMLLVAFIVLIMGLWFSSSRSMFLVLAVVFIVYLWQTAFIKGSSGRSRQIITIVAIVSAIIIISIQLNLFDFFQINIFKTIAEDKDTVGIRSKLWQAAFRMWIDYPITGVGIGQFQERLVTYGSDLLTSRYLEIGAHNMYISVLAETGIIGEILFVGVLLFSLRGSWRVVQANNGPQSRIAATWLLALLVMLLGGVTKHDQYEKFLWVCIGASAGIYRMTNDQPSTLGIT